VHLLDADLGEEALASEGAHVFSEKNRIRVVVAVRYRPFLPVVRRHDDLKSRALEAPLKAASSSKEVDYCKFTHRGCPSVRSKIGVHASTSCLSARFPPRARPIARLPPGARLRALEESADNDRCCFQRAERARRGPF